MKIINNYIFFWADNDIYSNFYPSKFYYKEHNFLFSEQCFMYLKALEFKDFEIAEKILNTYKPLDCKKLGRAIKNYDDIFWSKIREEKMFDACYSKFSQNSSLRKNLIETENKILVEASPYDKIWGIGLDENNPKILEPNNWNGLNLLGKVLMRVRDILKSE